MAHLYKRHGVFYYRFVTQSGGQRTERRGSLKTTDLVEAQRKLETLIEPVFNRENLMVRAGQDERTLVEQVAALQRQLEALKAQPVLDVASIIRQVQSGGQRTEPTKSTLTVADAVEKFTTEKEALGAWRPTIARKHGYTLADFQKVAGAHKLVSDFTRQDAGAYILHLRTTPQRHSPNLRQSNTVRNIVVLISSLFQWLVRNEQIEKNPFTDMLPKKDAGVDRRAFTNAELHTLLAATVSEDWQYWLPRIGLWSGMRLEEITQLRVQDIVQRDCIWVFDVNAQAGKQLKNTAASRLVPIHPEILPDLLKYRNTRTSEFLFDFKRTHYGLVDTPSHWFTLHKKALGFDSRVVFHSLRYNFVSAAKAAGMQDSVIGLLVGHTPKGVTHAIYGKSGVPLNVLEHEIQKISFAGVV